MQITPAAVPGTGDPNQLGQAPISVPVTGGETPMPAPDGVTAVPTNETTPATPVHQPIVGQSPNEGDSPRAAQVTAPDIAAIPDAQPLAVSQPAGAEPVVSADPTQAAATAIQTGDHENLEAAVGAVPAPTAETDQNLGTVAAGDTMQTQPIVGQSPNEGDSPQGQIEAVPPTAAPEVTAVTPDQIIAGEFAAPPPAAAEPAAIPTAEVAAPPPVAPAPVPEPVAPPPEVAGQAAVEPTVTPTAEKPKLELLTSEQLVNMAADGHNALDELARRRAEQGGEKSVTDLAA